MFALKKPNNSVQNHQSADLIQYMGKYFIYNQAQEFEWIV